MLSHVQLFATPWTGAYQAPHPWDSPGKNTGVGCHFLCQGIFLTQGLSLASPALAGGFFTTDFNLLLTSPNNILRILVSF